MLYCSFSEKEEIMKDKVWLIASVLLTISAIIVACAAPGTAPSGGGAAAPAGPAPVNFYTWAENDYEQWALDQMVAKFRATHPDIRVTLEMEH